MENTGSTGKHKAWKQGVLVGNTGRGKHGIWWKTPGCGKHGVWWETRGVENTGSDGKHRDSIEKKGSK